MTPTIGQDLSHYRITAELGSGGMGVVYKAEDTRLHRCVALKFLPQEFIRDSEAKERFLREAHAVSALDHPNICTLFEIDESPPGRMFMAMACYEGETIKEKIRQGQLTVKETIDLTLQIASGLAHAHAHGIIHRDIKPANIAVTKDGIVKILDFGLAKLVGNVKLTRTGSTAGTASYMSPEQARGDDVDSRTDVWSLGVVLFEMVTGSLPFKGEFEHAVVYSILNEAPLPLNRFRRDLPLELQPIIDKALQKNASDRYQHIEEMAADLKSVLASPSGTSRRLSTRALRPRARSIKILGWAALGVIAVTVVLLFLPFQSQSDNRIVVIPFKTAGQTSGDHALCDELTEEMISELSRNPAVSVLSRTSSMKLKETNEDMRTLGKQLDFQYVVEGIVRTSGSSVRISALLSQAANDRCLWAESYLRDANVDRDLPKEVASEIAKEIEQKLRQGTIVKKQ